MGVPAFFRWLTRKYPSVIIDCLEENPVAVDGVKRPVDAQEPNPNGVEFDNLYLDTNGIIHPCTHPEDKPAPRDEDEMMIAIFDSIDRLFKIVRPRKLLYIAIDGPAPRAKMNQQRSRRFRAAKEAAEKKQSMARLKDELEDKGFYLPPSKKKENHFDSNCITPGTPFMDRLSKCLQYYLHDRINNEPAWKNVKVILSDSNAPGEGEHKIMEYIRRQRAQPDHDPNTQHVLMGGDADLIMLGLATHEVNFTIIREEFKPNKPKPCDLCRQIGHEMNDCMGVARPAPGEEYKEETTYGEEDKYIFVRLSVLREYLKRDLAMHNLPFEYDFERALDDWVFMCFFVGNDFLPHLPSLEIRENAIDRLVRLYKDNVYKTGGFLTNNGIVSPDRVQLIMQELGKVEDCIFKERQERELSFRARNRAKRRRERLDKCNSSEWISKNMFPLNSIQFVPQNTAHDIKQMRNSGHHNVNSLSSANQSFNADSRPNKRKSDEALNGSRGYSGNCSDSDDEPADEVRLYEEGFKDRYYESKFGVLPAETEFRYRVAREYAYGLCWVLRYYYQGCPSWKWFYPYHYAPFASDFVKIDTVKNEFEKNTGPFEPLEQLMCVFPAASRSHVPKSWGELMVDPESPIIDIYPENFNIDLNGKKYAWQGVALLPFVNETRMKAALKPLYCFLTDEEVKRNERGDDRLFVSRHYKGGESLISIFDDYDLNQEKAIDAKIFDGMGGSVLKSNDNIAENGTYFSPVQGLEDVINNKVLCVRYRNLQFAPNYIFFAGRLKGAKDPPNVLKSNFTNERTSREEYSDRRHSRGPNQASGYNTPKTYGTVPPPDSSNFSQINQMQSNYNQRGNFSMGRNFNPLIPNRSPDLGNLMNGYNGMDLMQMMNQYSQISAASNLLSPMIPDLTSPGSLTSGLNRYEMSPWHNMTPYQNSMGSRIQSPNQRGRRPQSNNHTPENRRSFENNRGGYYTGNK